MMKQVDRAEACINRGGHVHLMGIGGIGMAGVAWLLKARGFQISGCDLQPNRQTQWLEQNGVQITIGHSAEHVGSDVDWLVRSTAVPDTHLEVQRALERGVPVSRRGEVLPALMRARCCVAVSGTHGKTTTTAMIAQILACGYCVGGEIAGVDGVAHDAELIVVEADESDGTVAGYTPDYAVITNIEYDHMEHHASEEAFIGCFEQLIQNTRKKVYYCADDPIAQQLCAGNAKCEPFYFPAEPLPVALPGRHNQWNGAAALAVCQNWRGTEELFAALDQIKAVRRRFETVYEQNNVRVVSDYAHHPTEIAALVQAALELSPKRLLAIFQPHRYTRTLALGPDFPPSFEGIDHLWVVPVYAASEQPLDGGSSRDLLARFPEAWGDQLHYESTLDAAWASLCAELQPGDLLLIIGAGDIEQLAERARLFSDE